jgi:protocatechuate 3,4-dioxygenase beta subunit
MVIYARLAVQATHMAIIAGLGFWVGVAGLASGQPPSSQRAATRFTEAPGKETEAAQRLIDQAKAALESGKSPTAILTDASFLPVHEWPRFRDLIRNSAQPPPLTIVSAAEPGEHLTVTGRVVDASGQPVKAAVVYFYQTSSKGWYSDRAAHIGGNEGDRRHARLFGYLRTDGEGRFELHTIRPAGYPDSDLPAHIHVEVEPAGKPAGKLITEIQFDDDPRLTAEWRKRSQQEGFIIAKVTTDSEHHMRVEVELKMR